MTTTTLDPDRRWQADVICTSTPAIYDGAAHLNEARAVCAVCPVRDICLPDALLTDDHKYVHGVRGGAGPKARRAMQGESSPAKLRRQRDEAITRWRAGEAPRLVVVLPTTPAPPPHRPARPCDACGVDVAQNDRGRPRLRCASCDRVVEMEAARRRRRPPGADVPPLSLPAVPVASVPAPVVVVESSSALTAEVEETPAPPPAPLGGVVVDGNRWRCVSPCNTPWFVCWGSVDPYDQSAEHAARHREPKA